jgi:hypothetical protein
MGCKVVDAVKMEMLNKAQTRNDTVFVAFRLVFVATACYW